MKASLGQRTHQLVELVDIYKTICELAGVPLPGHDTHLVEGASLVPLLQDPSGTGWGKTVALTVSVCQPATYCCCCRWCVRWLRQSNSLSSQRNIC
jgi:hypothetical protein